MKIYSFSKISIQKLPKILKYFFVSNVPKKPQGKVYMPFITGLRGCAALMVFLVHAGSFLGEYNPFLFDLVAIGRNGIIIFFVISAFTLCMSIARSSKFDFKTYIKRRILRIIPMYYVTVIVTFSLADFLGSPNYYAQLFHIPNYDFLNLLYHFTFFSFFDQKYLNTLVPVEWTIPLEFAYYLIIPLFFFFSRKIKVGIILLLGIGIFLYFNRISLPIYITRFGGGDWALETFFATYCFGIIAYFLSVGRHQPNSLLVHKYKSLILPILTSSLIFMYTLFFIKKDVLYLWLILPLILFYILYMQSWFSQKARNIFLSLAINNIGILGLIAIFILYMRSSLQAPEIFIALFSLVLLIACINGGVIVKYLFENKCILHMGKISYSF